MEPDSCRERIMHIVNEIKTFLTEVRIHEHLSSVGWGERRHAPP